MAGYLGNSPSDSSVRIARQIYTTSGVTTDFTFTSGYDPGYIDVYVNGERQTEGTNFTANDGSVVTILNGGVATASTVEVSAYKSFNVATVTLGEVTDVDDLTISGSLISGSTVVGSAVTSNLSGINVSGVVTATSFSGDGSALTGVASTDNIITGTAATFTNQVAIDNLSVTGVTTTGIATISTSAVVGSAVTVTATAITIDPAVTTTINGDVNFQGGNYNISRSRANSSIDFADNAKARFGTGNDLEIYANGSTSIIDSTNQNIDIQSSGVINIKPGDASGIIAWNGAQVELYHNANKKLETTSTGANLTGRLLVGATTDQQSTGAVIQAAATSSQAALSANRYSNNADGPARLYLFKSRGTSIDGQTIVQDGDDIGEVVFHASDGTDAAQAAVIRAEVDGTPGDNDMPGRLSFHTTADGAVSSTERLRIDSSGKVLIGTTTEGYSAADDLTIGDGSGNRGITIRSGTASQAAIYFSDGTSGDDEYRGMVFYNHSTEQLRLASNAATALILDSSQNATFSGTVADAKGDLRSIVQNTQGSSYALVASDAGKHILASGDITVPNSTFSAGDAVTIVNNTAGNLTLYMNVTTRYNAADGSTVSNFTLATRGVATLLFTSGTVCYGSGAGLS